LIWEWLCPRSGSENSLPPPEGLRVLEAAALRRARLAAGYPSIPDEFGPNDLPQEAGLEANAVSFTKGCYLGQEIMARLQAMGRVRRHLVRVAGPGTPPLSGAGILQAGKRCGEVRAAIDDTQGGWFGLALLQLLGLDSEAPLATAEGSPLINLDAKHTNL